jgi:hypothetical protein
MEQRRLRAVFMRGGTSKAVVFRQEDLPAERGDWDAIFLALMGSPDPNGRQLDGMGGGISSLSKVCVVGSSSRPDADIDYTFAQVAVDEATVDYSANCGNMSSAMGPFAVDEGFVPRPEGTEAVVRIHNTTTKKIIVSRFPMDGRYAAVDGDLAIDGVAGTGAPIRLDFTDPGGARTGRLLPTGNPVDELQIAGLGSVPASLVDAANPCVFVPADAVGAAGTELPGEIEADKRLLDRLEAIRRRAAVLMGMAADDDVAARLTGLPKVAMMAAPTEARTLSGRTLGPGDADIHVRMISMGLPHRAVPLTGSLCLAAACRVPGSVAHRLMAPAARDGDIRIGHPSGSILVAAAVRQGASGVEIPHATVYRTARRLFQGEVLFRGGTGR